jgi:hypothetical protein
MIGRFEQKNDTLSRKSMVQCSHATRKMDPPANRLYEDY